MDDTEGHHRPDAGRPAGPSRPGYSMVAVLTFVVDALCLVVGVLLANAARYDDSDDPMRLAGLVVVLAVGLVVFPLFAVPLRLHLGRYSLASADEFKALAVAVGGTTLVAAAVNFVLGSSRLVPLSLPVVAGLAWFILAIGFRLALHTRRAGTTLPSTGQRTLIFGAGEACQPLVRSMLWDPESPYLPVGLLDDDPAKRHVWIKGIRTLGGRESIATAARATSATTLVIAMPSADTELLRDLSNRASAAGLTVKVLPKLTDLLDRTGIGIRDVRDINIADLLGRRQIDTDVSSIADYLRGKRVLVTGAGGSIGSELCRQIDRFEPAELMMLDRDESALHALQLTMFGEARLDLPQAILADIRDADVLRRLFLDRRPEVVFHAAALKHLNMLEQYPDEGWKTNVRGTLNVLDAAVAADVSRFINVSTDKAADPANVLGATKRAAERLTASVAPRPGRRYLSVRFGNVLGSRGSVLETFAAQIAAGGPVTVTDPDVTRYFMTIPEAVQLVIQAGAIGGHGEALVLDMGQPVRISDVATYLIHMYGRDVAIRYTGLRPGEKLHEVLLGHDESDHRPCHPLISHVGVPPLDPMKPGLVRDATASGDGLLGQLLDEGGQAPADPHDPGMASVSESRMR